MDRGAQLQELNESLAKLETALLTPVVSGELSSWLENVEQSAVDLGQPLRRFLLQVQPQEYGQIAASDQELLHRVQQLAAQDQELLAALDHFRNTADKLRPMVQAALHHESKAEDQRSALEREGLDLVQNVRRHLVAADTWLAEAVYRDRGTKD
jgi:biopolymer transport protein ExbB/TolQ